MSEIVLADPIIDPSPTSEATTSTRPLTFGHDYRDHGAEPFDSERLPPTLASEIQRFLRVANLVEADEPRIAYLCRFHAFEIAHNRDHNSSGRGVRQFKTSLLQRLEHDDEPTFRKRKEKSDIRELRRVYHAYKDYIIRNGGAFDLENSDEEKLINARRIASVLYDVLKTVINATGPQAPAETGSICAKSELYVPYNILPLDNGGIQQAIMHLPEIKASVAAVQNLRGLPSGQDFQRSAPFVDLFEFLQCCFGFQEGNVANQREHLILLLANIHVRKYHKETSILKLGDGAVDELMNKFFKNYTNWCKFLRRKSNIRLPFVKQEAQQYKILYIGLYLLIWGEAANLRFIPECLCYIFHHMAYELHGMLTGAVSLTDWEKVMPAYGGGSESFLNKEAAKSKGRTADHSTWRNYDDLNEYFWSPDCFQIGWPMREDHNFFCVNSSNRCKTEKILVSLNTKAERGKGKRNEDKDEEEAGMEGNRQPKWLGKTNFVEIRSLWQIYRSFDRMWSFFVLSLQAMIVIASHDLQSPLQVFDSEIFEDILSIFITSAILKLIRAILDIAFAWKARCTMELSQRRKYVLRLVFAVIWVVVLPSCYAKSRRKYCFSTQYVSWLQEWCISSYMVAVAIYLSNNAVEVVLFFVPIVWKFIEVSNCRICTFFSFWAQPRLFVGRGMQETQVSILKYTLFWVLVLCSKFLFSYNFEIKPLIEPTKLIMRIGVENYDWHELFPKVKSNAGAIVAVWAPIVVVYFMDTQIWYSVFCTIFGGVYGVLHHLGEIRTLGMLRSRFHTLPAACNACLIPPPSSKLERKRQRTSLFGRRIREVSENKKRGIANFVLLWNQIITTFRSEDLISNREMDLMTMPMSTELFDGVVRWPIFLLANKFSTALSIARDFVGKDKLLLKKIKKDKYMYCAVKECYDSLKYILDILVVGDLEKRVVSSIFNEIEESIGRSSLLEDFKMSELPALQAKCIELVELLVEANESHYVDVVKVLQDIFELLTSDIMINGSRILDLLQSFQTMECDSTYFTRKIDPQLFESASEKNSIHFPLPNCGSLNEQIKRLLLLLTVKDKAMDIPANIEARRRVSFFATSLFMDMPSAPKIRNMLSFSVMTPHFMEDINYSMKELQSSTEGVSILFYMQRIYPDEWENFLERMGCGSLVELKGNSKEEELRNWASFRGQTLNRTVRGMMYYREALKVQAFLDIAENEDILEGYDAAESNNRTLSQLDALADLKFTYVISCQMFGSQKASGDPHAQDILDLMKSYPSLRVAYVEEKEEIVYDKRHKVYSSVLVKADNGYDQEIYRIKLPGPPNIGEGKPENQNHAIIFTRGEALQTIDMNQDNYLEEAFKMRNLLQELLRHHGRRPPTILGLREHIFTGSVSSLAWFMSYQETSFVTIGQRLLANPLRVRFHYGHPDVFDRLFHITRGGISKASKTINLSEDVFAGFNSTLRRGCITYHEYLQVGKGRDVGLNQISKFEAKIANGNSEQTLSRDIYRLGRRFDFFRMLSCYFTTVGFYFSSLISVIGIYVFLYGQLYLVLSGLEKALVIEAKLQNIPSLETALASQSFIQLGLLTGLPMVMEIGLEKGFLTAVKDFVLMQLQLAAVFFTFSLGTKIHYYGRTIMHGGAQYRPTGRKVVVFHASFTENYRLYSRSHFVKGFELMLLLIVYYLFRRSYQGSVAYVLITYSIWFMSITWLFAPFLFNPSGFSWDKIVDDWKDWNKWIKQQGGIGIQQDKSWQSWWIDEQDHLRRSGLGARLFEILLSLRFFMYQYGLVYHLDISQQSKNFLVYVLSWIVILAIFLLVKAVNMGRLLFIAKYHLVFRLFKAILFLSCLAVIVILSRICHLSLKDLIVCCLAFLPTGWGLILIAQVARPKIEDTGLWDFTLVLAKAYDYGMGVVLFTPIAVLAWLPIISAFQTRFLFNEAFNRRLQIQPILAGKKKE
ncbi:putative callose synthase 8 isoform X2 [Tripterygium wilfordii]|uniref:putative callose synthase 8 isoform X2 n=2 Tax=Tripterygium wilfordii TaxID=458696 RepID=UPI0018F85CCA|nr:putative callose synthase 8 isoform X2 [Tripterygium wilfordii]XP_038691775.1 putative callose synthase 8 isoform X2 [Tripterygium wilfordii]